MNPADIAASGLTPPSVEVSLLGMFWSAHLVVKFVMVGLLGASVSALFVAAMREWRRSVKSASSSFMGLQARIEKVLDVSIVREVEKLESNLLVLATVASAGPFIGLFGTVWGIMTAFRSIAVSRNTSLAVVAPGIAEALFATAIGLFAAIPALIAYNKFQGDVAKKQARLEGFADEFSAILSRQIDQRGVQDRAA
jgi:biopolymer transport protein TolQ